MPSTATVTSKTGPAVTVTSLAFADVQQFNLSLGGKSLLQIVDSLKGIKEFDVNATTTLTCTIAAGVATIVVSQ
jgi:hypothetical protein